MPTCSKLDRYECLHGLGYTKISSEKDGMLCETNYFIPIDTLLEIWKVTLNNSRDQAADLDLFSCVEFALWDAWEDFTELWAFRGTRNKIHVKKPGSGHNVCLLVDSRSVAGQVIPLLLTPVSEINVEAEVY